MNIWRLIAHHDRDKEEAAIKLMIKFNKIAIGWSDIDHLDNFSTQREISHAIRKYYPDLKNSQTGAPSLFNFKRIDVGDLVIVNVKGTQHSVFEITGRYTFVSEDKAILGYRHQYEAILRDIDAKNLWKSFDGVLKGQNLRWTLVKCGTTKETNELLYEEGARYSIESTYIERNASARQACIDSYGSYKCDICSFDFVETYGDIGKEFIHVHHIEDISLKKGVNQIDHKKDLIPVCPNCHAMLHKERPAMKPDVLRKKIKIK